MTKTSAPRRAVRAARINRPLLGLLAAGLLFAACAADGGTGPGWSFVPPGPTAQPTEPASPGPTDGETASPGPTDGETASPGPTDGEPGDNIVALEATSNLRYAQQGQAVDQLRFIVGEEYTFQVDNVAGFSHDIYLGPPDRLAAGDTEGLPGIPAWVSGVREMTWTATAEAEGWEFGCTVPGHYQGGMRGEIVLADE